eukprot:TRINITY_DN15666_c0_g3_i1.p1 TRINITY_DN15666_c0_g3~~TRINITY_DN15666_c0_g3_i1.p1  ORF type:complete len:269 (-),score=47.57 TRINITY_DN15666_c0_g3_i1:210-1016(-)
MSFKDHFVSRNGHFSCIPCRKSHLKCDRMQPCGQCLRKGRSDKCMYPEEQTDRAFSKETNAKMPDLRVFHEYSQALSETFIAWLHRLVPEGVDGPTKTRLTQMLNDTLDLDVIEHLEKTRDINAADPERPRMVFRFPFVEEFMFLPVLGRPGLRILDCNEAFAMSRGMAREDVMQQHPLVFLNIDDMFRVLIATFHHLHAHHSRSTEIRRHEPVVLNLPDVSCLRSPGTFEVVDSVVTFHRSSLCFPTIGVVELFRKEENVFGSDPTV